MASYTDYRYQFNGPISTDKTVMQNLESLCTAAGCWPAYDIHSGKWSVVINKAGTSIASFNDANIIGAITVSGSGLTALYNKVKVQFPHIDLNDNPDYTIIEIPNTDRNANEPDNTLNMQLDVINDPVQAQLISGINLKQSRVDKVIRFVSDFSKLGLKAGDLIDITSTVYGFTNKMFRITSIIERDDDNGAIQLDITALEYDANVYDTSDLNRYAVSNSTGIVAIGAIGIPGTPTVDKVERNSRPNITVHTTAPTGIVEAIEFWYTIDVPPGNNVDSTRNYKLLGTVRPTTGTTYSFGTAVSLNIDSLGTSNFLIKARGINSTTTGPFTTPAGIIYYAPVQTTDAIGPDTAVVDSTGALVTTLAATYLLGHVDDIYKGLSSPGSIFDKIMNIYDNVTGGNLVALGTPGGTISSITPTSAAEGYGYTFTDIGLGQIIFGAPAAGVSSVTVSQAAYENGISVIDMGTGEWQIQYSSAPISINADYAVISWTFTDGLDLDIRAYLIVPDVGQNTIDDALGYTGGAASDTYDWPTTGTPLIRWGGDNQGTGEETVLVDIAAIKAAYPAAPRIILECYGNWYTTRGFDPVKLAAILYEGGSMSHSGYNWTNTSFTTKRKITGLDAYVDSIHGTTTMPDGYDGGNAPGDLMGYFIFDTQNNTATFTKNP
jgi:hypothetical protein